jgi:hypothetical protein
MGRGRQWWIVLGALTGAFVVLSMPVRVTECDTATEGEVLFRIQPGGEWELWHGPTRSTQVRIATGAAALESDQDPWVGNGPAERALRQSITALRGMLAPAIRAGPDRVRIELPGDEPLRFALRVAEAAALEGFQDFEITNERRGLGVPIRVAPDLAQIRRTDLHPEDPRLARLVLAMNGDALGVALEGIGTYPVGPAQGDFVPEGSRIKWGAPRTTEAGRWLCIGYDIIEWESPLDAAGLPTAPDDALRQAARTPLSHLYLELPDFNVRSDAALHVLGLVSEAAELTPEYLVLGFDFENALGGN